MDRGGEYRSLVGFPGGEKNPAYSQVEAAAAAKGMTLVLGKGNDPDTLGTKKIYVYDTAKFPFYQAEVYHQFREFLLFFYTCLPTRLCTSFITLSYIFRRQRLPESSIWKEVQ